MSLLLEIDKAVEAAVRPEMKLSSWLMLIFAILVLVGGLVICIRRAISVNRRKREEGVTVTGEGDD